MSDKSKIEWTDATPDEFLQRSAGVHACKFRWRLAAGWGTRTWTVFVPAAEDGCATLLNQCTNNEFPGRRQTPVPDSEFKRNALERLEAELV